MIVTSLSGGLGNQMFQYATARSLADRLGVGLELDIRDLATPGEPAIRDDDKGVVRVYGLDLFQLRAGIANRLGLAARGFFVSRKIRYFLAERGWLQGDYIREKKFTHQEVKAKNGNFTYLEGYWQSWKYIGENRENIQGDFSLKTEATGRNLDLLGKIRSRNSVCIHVRLGDYISSTSASTAHGNLTASYYQAVLRRIRRRPQKFSYFLFSDEPEKAMRFIPPGIKVAAIDHNVGSPHEDLRLMSACKTFAIANSSFSWWAAWLSQRSGKCVFAPRNWFAGLGHDTRDLIPREWTRV